MRAWELLDTAPVPRDGAELRLYRRGEEFELRVNGADLMNSRVHGSEDELGRLACEGLEGRPAPAVLIGGLGMGFTLAAALARLGPGARVEVAELVPEVVRWNQGPLAPLAGRPLEDPRVRVLTEDVARLLRRKDRAYDAIALDVDNGPEGLVRQGNDWLYSDEGLGIAQGALKAGGLLAVWSSRPDKRFAARLWKSGFRVSERPVRARGMRGAHHTIWLARA